MAGGRVRRSPGEAGAVRRSGRVAEHAVPKREQHLERSAARSARLPLTKARPARSSRLLAAGPRAHVDGDGDLMRAAADDEAVDRAHVTVVAAPRERDVLDAGDHVVRRVEVDPTRVAGEYGHPRVRRVGAYELLFTFGRTRQQITADVPRGQ